MVKKNRHRAGRKKKERIERAQQAALRQAIRQFEEFTGHPVAQSAPLPGNLPSPPPGRAIFTIDLTEEDTVPLDRYEELINQADTALNEYNETVSPDPQSTTCSEPENSVNAPVESTLEPLNPDAPYDGSVITRYYLNLEEVALVPHDDPLDQNC